MSALTTEPLRPAVWEQALTRDPEVLHRLLGDLWNVVSANRGLTRQPSVEEVFGVLAPNYATVPFCEAVRTLLDGRSVGWLARRLHLHRSHVHRWVSGERPIVDMRNLGASMAQVEAVAQVLEVHPAHFAEWRRMWVLTVIDEAFEAHPNLSIGVWRKFSRIARRGK